MGGKLVPTKRLISLFLISLIYLLIAACTASAGIEKANAITETALPTNQVEEMHRIGIRQINGSGEFYDLQSGEQFIPRGVNYVFVPSGSSNTTKLLKVGVYDPQRTRRDFEHLAELGYNCVRVFLDHCSAGTGCITEPGKQGLNPAYLDNITDMMLAAKNAGVYILFTSNDLPDAGGYADKANSGTGSSFAGYRNSYYLRPQSISATRQYWGDLLSGLKDRNAVFENVLGWELLNEQWMFKDQAPLSLNNGLVETTTGVYDMHDEEQKIKMVSDGLVYYITQMKQEILLYDPNALISMGFFVPELVAPDWYVETASLLEKSDLDFFDFHAYPGSDDLHTYAEAFGMAGYDNKPIVLGEYGPFRNIYPDIENAAQVTGNWAADACREGFDGWFYWSYYADNAGVGDRTWGLVDQDNYLLKLFAPLNQPDICQSIEVPNSNIAYNKAVSASASLVNEKPENTVDNDPATQWGAGASPTQWISIDLEGNYKVEEIRLLVAQWPEGKTTHLVQMQSFEQEEYQTMHEFNRLTKDGDWLSFKPEIPIENIVQIRILTTHSPSWVAWKEIQVYGSEVQP